MAKPKKDGVVIVPIGKSSVAVASKLPFGLLLEHPKDKTKQVEIKGLNKSNIIGAPHMITKIDGEFWADWKAANVSFPALEAGSIFDAETEADVDIVALDYLDEKTGFEPLEPESNGVKKMDNKE